MDVTMARESETLEGRLSSLATIGLTIPAVSILAMILNQPTSTSWSRVFSSGRPRSSRLLLPSRSVGPEPAMINTTGGGVACCGNSRLPCRPTRRCLTRASRWARA